ncbi:hypothetical protein MPSEU_000438300 [Mayamaea pseudoterrestris]|nr:hypothetical protein MPSEU_000438300 [Mayamaea pseudoterrestris]
MTANGEAVAPEQPRTRTIQQWRCDYCQQKAFTCYEAACAHEKECQKLQDSKSTEAKSSKSSKQSSDEGDDSQAQPLKQPERAIQVIDIFSSPEEVVEVAKTDQPARRRPARQATLFAPMAAPAAPVADSKTTAATRITNKQVTKRSTAKGKAAKVPLIFQGVDQNQLMAEQAAVEFRAKRLLQQQKDRERAEKRQKQQEEQIIAAPVSTKVTLRTNGRPKAKSQFSPAPRFPVPSHVIPKEHSMQLNAKQSLKLSFMQSSETQPWWRRKLSLVPKQNQIVEKIFSQSTLSLLPPKDSIYAKQPPVVDCLQLTLKSTLIPPTSVKTKSRTWADVYLNDKLLVNGFVPAHLKEISDEMIAFVQGWMVERRNAHDRAAEKQRRLTRKLQSTKQHRLAKKTKSSKLFDDDDWLGSDCSDDEGDGLKNICHLTGPSGLGKSALVYAVARHCGCRVIELNPSDKRNAAAVRKVIEEATQSHSSIALLQKQEKAAHQSSILEDSDQEENDEGKGSVLPVILIDEIDNLDSSDGGFWSALSDVTKRAKCPVFLTSNVQPGEIKILNGRCGVLPLRRAKPSECIGFIRSIVDGEGFVLRSDNPLDSEEAISLIADLCNSDLRRIAHELQLFATQPLLPTLTKEMMPRLAETSQTATYVTPHPQILAIEPRGVRFDRYELLTITGTGFLGLAVPPNHEGGGYKVDVYIGDCPCPVARIMNDSTILAVSAPIPLPRNFRHTSRFHDEEYQAITISSTTRLGVVSSTSQCPATVTLPNGLAILQCSAPVLLHRHFSDVRQLAKCDGSCTSDGEMEFDEPKPTASTTVCVRPKFVDMSEASRILTQGITGWEGHKADVSCRSSGKCSLPFVTDMSRSADLISDAALLDDVAFLGQPYLSGACRGFSYDLTNAYPATANERTKPPNFERMLTSGWNDECFFFGSSDCYMASTLTTRDKHLLKLTESALRGQSCHTLTANTSASEDDQSDDKLKEEDTLHTPSVEDSLLAASLPGSLLALSFYLRNASELPYDNLTTLSRNVLFDRKIAHKVEHEVDLLDEFVFPSTHPVTNSLFYRGLSRELDSLLLSRELADPQLFQVTLPMLRVMCVHETINKIVADSLRSEDTLAHVSKRRTRNSRGAQHCLERISPMFNNNDGDGMTSWDVGKLLSDASLLHVS